MSHVVIEQVYSTLMSLDPDANPYPDLAESFEVSGDGLEYTFHLRPGVTFHNGDPLTAEDVKFTFDRLRAPDSGYSYGSQVETINEVAVVDPQTVRFTLSVQTGPFLTYMAFPGPRSCRRRWSNPATTSMPQPIGSGPFKFVSYQPRSKIMFERNPGLLRGGQAVFRGAGVPPHRRRDGADQRGAFGHRQLLQRDSAQGLGDGRARRPGSSAQTLEGSRYYWLLPNNSTNADGQSAGPPGDRPCDRPPGDRRRRLLRPGDAHPRRRHSGMELGLCRPRGIHARRRSREGKGTARGGRLSRWVRDIAHHGVVVPGDGCDGADHPGQSRRRRHQGRRSSTMEIPRYWDEVWGPSKFDMTAMYWVSPLADPDDFVFNNYACGMPINVQKSCTDGDGRAAARRRSRRPRRRRARRPTCAQQQLSLEEMPIVPLVNAWILTAHTDKLKNYRPMRTGFLKTLKDAWLRLSVVEAADVPVHASAECGSPCSAHPAASRGLRADAAGGFGRPVRRDQCPAGLGGAVGARHRRDAAGDRPVRGAARPRPSACRAVWRVARQRARRRFRHELPERRRSGPSS